MGSLLKLQLNNTIDMWDWAFWNIIVKWLRSRSIACYLGLYEEGEVEYINGPSHPTLTKGFTNPKVKGVKCGGYL